MPETRETGRTAPPRSWLLPAPALVCLALFLCPLKLGSVIGGGESADFPIGWVQWTFVTWPPFLTAVLAGAALAATGVIRSRDSFRCWRLLVPGAWFLLFACALPGLVRTHEWDYSTLFLSSVGAACALAWAVQRTRGRVPQAQQAILWAVAVGTLLCCLSGWQQRFGGLEATRRQVLEQAARQGTEVPPALLGRLEQGRAFGPFVYPNSYAAHLILTGPLVLLLLWRVAGRVQPPAAARVVLVGGGALVLFGALWFSGSRGAYVATVGGAVIAVLSLQRFRAWRWPLLAGGIVLAAALLGLASRGRNLLSVSSRMTYYTTAVRMAAARPFTGVGLGEFFHEYLRLKPILAEETRAAHSMILSMVSQAGILGGLAASLCVGLPVLLLFMPSRLRTADEPLFACLVGGVAAWGCHSLVDFNLQITGTVVTAAALPVFCLAPPGVADGDGDNGGGQRLRVAALVIGVLVALSGLWRVPGERAFQRLVNDASTVPVSRLDRRCAAVAAKLPLSPYPWQLLARRYESSGDWAAARQAYRRAAARSPHRASFRARIAENSLRLGEWDAACAAAGEACRRYPGNAQYQMLAALADLARTAAGAGGMDVPLVVRSALGLRARWEPSGVPNPVVQLSAGGEPQAFALPVADLCDVLNRRATRSHPAGGELRFEPRSTETGG